jgi:hypothetical protein
VIVNRKGETISNMISGRTAVAKLTRSGRTDAEGNSSGRESAGPENGVSSLPTSMMISSLESQEPDIVEKVVGLAVSGLRTQESCGAYSRCGISFDRLDLGIHQSA